MIAPPGSQSLGDEVFIGTIDVWQLRELHWPILRMFARRYVEERELGRYVRELLATQKWQAIKVIPHADTKHVFDLYGQRFKT
jgi:hypothetical protein